jgi:hypothetical protein
LRRRRDYGRDEARGVLDVGECEARHGCLQWRLGAIIADQAGRVLSLK